VRELLARGANINAATGSGRMSLLAASQGGHLDIVRELLAHGADPNTATIYGLTPLISSSCYGHVEVVRALLAAGADKHRVANNGDTAASVAGSYAPHSHAAILELLAAAPRVCARI
jgi:ankyrin repeat protein